MTLTPTLALDPELLLNPGQVARLFRVAPKTVLGWCASGDLRHYRLSARVIRIDPNDLDDFARLRSVRAAEMDQRQSEPVVSHPPSDVGRRFGERVEALLTELGWSRRRLARETGLSVGTVNSFLVERRCPRVDTAYRIALALDTTLDDLLDPFGRSEPT
jgi:ribosome-binding protein aMBF1 (putative translation factor)